MLNAGLPQPVLEGERTRLEPLAEGHLARALRWVNDPYIMATVLRVTPVTWEDQLAWYAGIRSSSSRLVWAIHWKRHEEHIGNTGIYHLDTDHARGEFWIYLGEPAYRGLGAASEALKLVLQHAFEALELERIYLHVGVDNHPARSLYTRHHFKEEGILRRHYRIGDKPIDVAVMSLLRQEYESQQHA